MGGVLEIKYSEDLHQKAVEFTKKSLDSQGRLNNKSERSDGGGIYIGYVSEQIVSNKFGWKKDESLDWDLVTDNNQKMEIKCREVNQNKIPCSHYEAGVYAYYKQKCDHYCFTRVNKGVRKCWILGFASKDRFFEEARFIKAGTVDPSNNRKFGKDIYNITLGQLSWPKGMDKFLLPFSKK